MKKIIASIIAFLLVFSGCSLFKKDPQKAVNEGIANFADVEKMNSSLVLKGTIQAVPPEKPSKVQFTVNVAGKTDSSEEKSPKIDTKLKLELAVDGQKTNAEFLFRAVDKKVFISLSNLEVSGEENSALKNQLASFLNTWWSIPMSEESGLGKIQEEQEKLKEDLKTIKFFTNAKEEGEEEVQGIKTIKYRVDLDKEAVKKFVLDIARLGGNALTPEEEIAIGDSLKDVNFSGLVYVGDGVIHRVVGTLSMQPADGPNSVFEVDYTSWGYGEKVEVTAPESSKEFNPLMILPLLSVLTSPDQTGTSTPAQ